MSTKRTIINADEELVIKGKLTIEGNVTQIETTQQVTNLQGNVFTINSDGSNTSAVLALNSNGTVASFTFNNANDNIVVNKPIIFTSGNVSASIFVGNVIGNVTGFVSSIGNFTTTDLREGANLYYTVARSNSSIQNYVSVTDTGGDGSLSLSANSSQLVITYTGPSQAEANARIDARLSGGDGVDYTSGVIAVDNTVVRTTGTQTITGNTTFVGTTLINGNIVPTTANTGFIGTPAVHIGEVWANLVHAERLDLGDADLSDIHATFYAGTPTGNVVSADTSTAGGLIYNHKQTGQANAGGYYRVNAGAGLTIDGNGVLKVDNTVITTAGGTINGNLTINGQLNYQNVVDSYVTDTIITLNANALVNNHVSIVAHRPANVDVEIKWNETEERWQFTNDGITYVNIVEISDLDGGNGLILNGNGILAVGAGDGIIVNADNVSVDSTVVRTTGNQSLANIKTFTGELVIPSSTATSNGAIFYDSANSQAFIRINDTNLEITPASLVGDVEDVGSAGINLYAGSREVPGSSASVTQSFQGARLVVSTPITMGTGSYVTIPFANVTSQYDTESFANVTNNSFDIPSNSTLSYAEIYTQINIDQDAGGAVDNPGFEYRTEILKNGVIIVQNGYGANGGDIKPDPGYISTGPILVSPGDQFQVRVFQDAGVASAIKTNSFIGIQGILSTPSVEASKIHGIKSIDDGTYTTLTEASNVITVDANITAIRGAFSTSNIAGYGNLSYNSSNGLFSYSGVTDSQIRTLFSGSGLITYNSANGSITTSADNYSSWSVLTDSGNGAIKAITSGETLTIQSGTGITVTNTGNVITITNSSTADITGVSAGNGLVGGGNTGDVTLDIAAGDGITVSADNVSVNVAYVRNQFSANAPLAYNASTGIFTIGEIGDIEGVTAGNGLIGGGTSGNVTLDIVGGDGIIVNADNVVVNASYIKGLVSVTDNGGDGSLSYDNANGVITYTGPNQSEANTRIDARLSGTNGIVYSNGVISLANTTAGAGLTFANGVLAVGSGTGITVNADDVAVNASYVKGLISVTDSGGDGSLSYDNANGVITYTGPSQSDANARMDAYLVGGSGLTYSSGTFNVGAGSYINVGANDVSVNASTTATANTVVARDASGNITANVFVGVSTSARYADLAENYLADGAYLPGTVLVFGGEAEVTASTTSTSTRIAGVVTTQPAHVMNSHLVGPHVACIALRGRVPVKVMGVVRKGDVLVSAGEGHVGYAVAALYPRDVPAAAMVGKSIEDKLDNGFGVVEALI